MASEDPQPYSFLAWKDIEPYTAAWHKKSIIVREIPVEEVSWDRLCELIS